MSFHDVMRKFEAGVVYGDKEIRVYLDDNSVEAIVEVANAISEEFGVKLSDVKVSTLDIHGKGWKLRLDAPFRAGEPDTKEQGEAKDNGEEEATDEERLGWKDNYKRALDAFLSKNPDLKPFVEFVIGKGYSHSTVLNLAYVVKKHFVDGKAASEKVKNGWTYKEAKKLWDEFTSKQSGKECRKWIEVDEHFSYCESDGVFKIKFRGKQYYATLDDLRSLFDSLPESSTASVVKERASELFGEVDESFAIGLMKFFARRVEFDADVTIKNGRFKLIKGAESEMYD